MATPDFVTQRFLRAFLFVLLPAFITVALAVSRLGSAFAAFSSSSAAHNSHSADIFFFAPFALAWLTCFTTAPPLMYVVAALLVPWALLSILLVFIAPPFGIPGLIVIGVWYRYFFAVRRSWHTSISRASYVK
jgi:hypothetical protein